MKSDPKNSATAPASFRQKVGLVLFSILLTLILVELGIRTRDALIKDRGFFSNHRNELANIRPVLPFRTFGYQLYYERDGRVMVSSRWVELFPFEKTPGVFRIVCFGGSSTENKHSYTTTGRHYPLALGEKLRQARPGTEIEVINVGYSAYSTAHSLVLLELNVLDWDPDLVILSHNVNDLLAAYFPGFSPDYSNKYGHDYYGLPDLQARFSLPNVLFQNFQVYWVLKKELSNLGRSVGRDETEIRRRSYGMNPPERTLHVFRRNLENFVLLAQKRGAKVILGSQPLQPDEESFTRHMNYKPYNEVAVYPEHPEFVSHHRIYNQALREVAEKTGAGFVDNDLKLGGREEYFIDFVHYTPEGVEALASSWSEFILEKGLIAD